MPYDLLSQAILFATEKHMGSYRDGDFGLPYATHPVEVVSLLRYVGRVTDEPMLCAAALHDVLEETSVPASELKKRFGKVAGDLVVELTRTEPAAKDIEGLSKDEIWQIRSELLLDDIRRMSSDAMAIKLSDRLANLREAKRTKRGDKLSRYIAQSKTILKIIHKDANPHLWRAIRDELA